MAGRTKSFTLSAGDVINAPLGFRARSLRVDTRGGLSVTELRTGQTVPIRTTGAVLAVDVDHAWASATAVITSGNVGTPPPATLFYSELPLPQAAGNVAGGAVALSYFVYGGVPPVSRFPAGAAASATLTFPVAGAAFVGQAFEATRLLGFLAPTFVLTAANRVLLWQLVYTLGAGGLPPLPIVAQGLVNSGAQGASADTIDAALRYPFTYADGDAFALNIYTADGANMAASAYAAGLQVWFEPAQ